MKYGKEVENVASFYEGKFVEPKLYFPSSSLAVKLGLILSMRGHVQVYFESNVKKSKCLLDLGCGGGWELFARRAERVVGVDYSKASLIVAKKLYYDCVKADIRYLPFSGCSFDFVASSDVLGHIPGNSKGEVISEIRRVLREGRETFHCIETDGQGPLSKWAKKYPTLYQKYFVAADGHYGLELPKIVIERFSGKFEICRMKKVYSGLFWSTSEYVKRFRNQFEDKSVFVKILAELGNAITRNFYLHAIVDCVLGVASRVFDIFTPLNWGDGIYILCKK